MCFSIWWLQTIKGTSLCMMMNHKTQNSFWEAYFFWPAPEMFSQYLPQQLGKCNFPSKKKETSSLQLLGYWIKRNRTTRSYHLQSGHFKAAAFAFWPQKGCWSKYFWQSCGGRSCVGVGKELVNSMCVYVWGQEKSWWRVTRYLYFLWFYHNAGL